MCPILQWLRFIKYNQTYLQPHKSDEKNAFNCSWTIPPMDWVQLFSISQPFTSLKRQWTTPRRACEIEMPVPRPVLSILRVSEILDWGGVSGCSQPALISVTQILPDSSNPNPWQLISLELINHDCNKNLLRCIKPWAWMRWVQPSFCGGFIFYAGRYRLGWRG